MSKHIITAAQENAGERLDKFLSQQIDEISRSMVCSLIESNLVTVNLRSVSKNYKIKGGEEIAVEIPKPQEYTAEAENIALDIVYEDDDLLVVNKPKGMVVHPAPGNYSGTLVNALLWHCKGNLSGINGVIRPGIVHRIDKDTSGLLIVAKNDFAHNGLAQQIKAHSFERAYEAVATGHFRENNGTVNAPIGRNKNDRKKMSVTEINSRNAVTHYRVIREYRGFSHIECRLETGRTHQIRVHMAYLGHPLAGDTVYGGCVLQNQGFTGQCLHARKIGFIHPRSGEYLEFVSELPQYFSDFLERLGKSV